VSDADRKRAFNQQLGNLVQITGTLWIQSILLLTAVAIVVEACTG